MPALYTNLDAIRVRAARISAARRFELLLLVESGDLKFRPNQPRVPAGRPDAGQWIGANIILIGGFERSDLNKTVQTFKSETCQAKILRVLPGQFLDMQISEVMKIAKTGNRAARSCLKTLGREEYRK